MLKSICNIYFNLDVHHEIVYTFFVIILIKCEEKLDERGNSI